MGKSSKKQKKDKKDGGRKDRKNTVAKETLDGSTNEEAK
jgi:hypothetical protein